jgi:hypothetical protein
LQYIKQLAYPYSVATTHSLWKHKQPVFIQHWRGLTINKVIHDKPRYGIALAKTKYLYGIQVWIGKSYFSITKDTSIAYRQRWNAKHL